MTAMFAPTAVTQALSTVKFATGDAIGNLHALHYHWDKLDQSDREYSVAKARSEIEAALVAIINAENAIRSVETDTTDRALAAIADAIGLDMTQAASNVVAICDRSTTSTAELDLVLAKITDEMGVRHGPEPG